MSDPLSTTRLRRWVDEYQRGDAQACNELLANAQGCLERLARRMLRDDRVQRWVQTGDLLNVAMFRLVETLRTVTPTSVRHFLQLSSRHLRRVLIELARQAFGPHGVGANHASDLVPEVGPDSSPVEKLEWVEFHERVAQLPPEQREAFELRHYQGLSFREAGEIMGCSHTAARMRYNDAAESLRPYIPGHD